MESFPHQLDLEKESNVHVLSSDVKPSPLSKRNVTRTLRLAAKSNNLRIIQKFFNWPGINDSCLGTIKCYDPYDTSLISGQYKKLLVELRASPTNVPQPVSGSNFGSEELFTLKIYASFINLQKPFLPVVTPLRSVNLLELKIIYVDIVFSVVRCQLSTSQSIELAIFLSRTLSSMAKILFPLLFARK